MNHVNQKNNLISIYMLLFVDILAILLAYIAAYYCRFGYLNIINNDSHKMVLLCIIVVSIIYSLFLEWNKSFLLRGYLVEIGVVTKYNIVLLIATAILVFVFRQGEFYSRLVFGYFAVINEVLTLVLHELFKYLLRKYLMSSRQQTRVMVITVGNKAEELIKRLKAEMPLNYSIDAICCWDGLSIEGEIEGVPVIATKHNVIEIAKTMVLDEVFINLPGVDSVEIKSIIQELEVMGTICHYNVDIADWSRADSSLGEFGGYTVISYSINNPNYNRMIIKRLMDILGAIIGLIITIILFPIIAIAIKVDSEGPVIFSQIRIGKNGRQFKLYKFRSMYSDAEARKKELIESNEIDGLMFKMENDPRITKVGRFLRKTSLDELPQFYNILIGDMSLVGTRPPTVDEFEQYSSYYRRRICMTPGLTGMWQVSGRSDIRDFNEVVRLDLKYIDNWSLTLDLKIILMTIGVVIKGSGSK